MGTRRQPLDPPPRPSTRRAGMTLIEVLLALTILGTGVVILVTGAARSLSIARRAQHYSAAQHLLALVDLELPILTAGELAQAPESGTFEPPYELYRWERTAEFYGPEQDQLFLVRTRVTWSDRGSETSEEVVTLVRDTEAAIRDGAREGMGAGGAADAGAGTDGGDAAAAVRPGMRVRPDPSTRTGDSRRGAGDARESGRTGGRDGGRGDLPAPGGGDRRSGGARPAPGGRR
jgi:prepilin-type N-terminal cleavage/methylation domain-containing protein